MKMKEQTNKIKRKKESIILFFYPLHTDIQNVMHQKDLYGKIDLTNIARKSL